MPTFTYLIFDGEFTKIGVTDGSVEQRRRTLQTGSPLRLIITAIFLGNHEQALHKQFDHLRVRRDGEWFRLSQDDVRKIGSGSPFYCWLVNQIGNCAAPWLPIASRKDWISDLARDAADDPSFPRYSVAYREIKHYLQSEQFRSNLSIIHYNRQIRIDDVLFTFALAFRNWKRSL